MKAENYAIRQQQQQQVSLINPFSNINLQTVQPVSGATKPNDTDSSIINTTIRRRPKKLPNVAVCHGCCVKITSKMPDGGKIANNSSFVTKTFQDLLQNHQQIY